MFQYFAQTSKIIPVDCDVYVYILYVYNLKLLVAVLKGKQKDTIKKNSR